MNILTIFLRVVLISMLAGCAAVGVVKSNDPATKLADAKVLIFKLDRPLPAERLIREAIEIYQKQGDVAGLAEAYRIYGFFFKSGAVDHWAFIYRESGFLDKTATFDTRYIKSVQYFNMSKAEWAKIGRHDNDSNLELHKALAYLLMKDTKRACKAYEASLAADREYAPTGEVKLPPGFTSFADLIQHEKRRAHCEP